MFDKSHTGVFCSVPVGGRFGSTKLEVRGIFKGANVARGPDWEYKNQDGGSECEGVVIEITDWDNDSKRDAARVSWQRGQRENVYRIGREGKVERVSCISKLCMGMTVSEAWGQWVKSQRGHVTRY